MGDHSMISFPSNPNVNDVFTINNSTYVYDGKSWVSQNGLVLSPGQGSALNIFMTNPTTALTADSSGVVASYSGTENNIYVFQGNTELSYDGIGTANGKFKVINTTESNIVFGGVAGVGNHAYLSYVSSFNSAAENAYIDYTVSGKDLNGVAFSCIIRQTFSKAKQGIQGIQGPAGSGGSGSTDDITLYKYGEYYFNNTSTTGKALNITPLYYNLASLTMGFSPSTKQIYRTNSYLYEELNGLNKIVGFSHTNNYRLDMNVEIITTFSMLAPTSNNTFFVGMTGNSWTSMGNYVTSICSVQQSQLGIGYNETNANWQLSIPSLSYPNILVNLGIPKPANNDMYEVKFKFDYTALTVNIKLTNLDTNTLLINETVHLDETGTVSGPGRQGFYGSYSKMYFNCYLSSGGVAASTPQLGLSRTYYKHKENKQ